MGNIAYRLNRLGMDGVTADHVESMMVFLHHGHVSVMGTAQWLANQRVDPQLAIQLARSAWWMNPSIPDIYNRLLDAKAEVWRKTSTKAWDEASHPRHPGGGSDGGQFAPKGDFTSFASDDDVRNYAKEKLNRPIPPKSKKILQDYKVSDYKWINGELRSGGPFDKTSVKYQKALDDFIDQSELQDDLVVYRGLRSQTITENFDDLVGAEIQDLAYVSTSMSKLTAGRFKAAYMDGALDMGEFELLLPRGSRFRVIETSIEDVEVYDEMRKTKCVTLEVIK